MNQIEKFWQWFSENRDRFACSKNSKLFLDLILTNLREINPGLFLEMSLDLNPKEFIVTTAGNTKLFSLADEIISYAPRSPDWLFFSLKPAKGFQFKSNYRGFLFDPRKMWFMPLKKRDDHNFLGLQIGYESGSGFADEGIVRGGTFLVLDTGLGERMAATNIHYLEIVELPENPRASGYGKVTELTEYLR